VKEVHLLEYTQVESDTYDPGGNEQPRHVAKERNADLRDFYLYNLSAFHSYHLVFVDESGYDKRIGFRRTGWSPLGITPVQPSLTSLWMPKPY